MKLRIAIDGDYVEAEGSPDFCAQMREVFVACRAVYQAAQVEAQKRREQSERQARATGLVRELRSLNPMLLVRGVR